MRKEDSLSQVTITIPIESEIIKMYFSDKEMFRSTHYAANTAASVYPFLREVVLDSLKGTFKKDEGVVFLHSGGTPALFVYKDQILELIKDVAANERK